MTRLSLVAATILAITSAAHAMGSDIGYAVEAWNVDGSAALLSRVATHEGDEKLEYFIVSATGTAPTRVLISERGKEGPGKYNQSVDAGACTRAARDLERALAAKKFREVIVHADRCKTDKRDLVTVGAASSREVERSWVAMPQARTASAREQAAEAVLKITIPNYHSRPLDYTCDSPVDGIAEVSAVSPRVLLVFDENTCNSPARTKVRVLVPKGKSFVQLLELD